MSAINTNNLLGELQRLATAAGGGTVSNDKAPAAADFGSVLKTMLSNTSQTQQDATSLAQSFELGEDQADLAQVMIAQQKARLSFQTVLQVRNKVMAAYQDIMNMPL